MPFYNINCVTKKIKHSAFHGLDVYKYVCVFRLVLVVAFTVFFARFSSLSAAEDARRSDTTVNRLSKSTRHNSFNETTAVGCPPALVEWINDDFKDKSTLGIFDFPSEAKNCLSPVRIYAEGVKRSGGKTKLFESEKMSSFLANQFKQISPNAKDVLNRCNGLPDGKDKIVKARYYMATTKLEANNSALLDEIAAIDNVIPFHQVVPNLNCNAIFPFPEVGKKCEVYRDLLRGSCNKSKAPQLLEELVQKTKNVITELRDLNEAYRSCLSAGNKAPCELISMAIQLKKSQAPWIDGKKFEEKSNLIQFNPFWSPRLKDETLKKGIVEQLTENRKILLHQYGTNLQKVSCLTYSTRDGKPPCSFSELRQHIAHLPNLPETSTSFDSSKKPDDENIEYSKYVEAEKCLIERGAERETVKKNIDSTAVDIGLISLTAGLGWATTSGLKLIKGMSDASRLKTLSLANSIAVTGNLENSVHHALLACQNGIVQSSSALTPTAKKEDQMKSGQPNCPISSSSIHSTYGESSDCMIDVLLTGLDVWPFLKGLKITSQFSKFTKEDLLKLYKNPSQRAEIESILSKNGAFSNEAERTIAAEKLLGRKLLGPEKECLLEAHKIGGQRKMATSTAKGEVLNLNDLLAKKSTLSKCGLSSVEVALLLRSGITGMDSAFVLKRNPQLVIWELEASGRTASADELRKKVEEKLKTAKIKEYATDQTRQETTGLVFVEFEDGSRGIWKTWPKDDSGFGMASTKKEVEREIVAYRLDRLIGANLVPITVPRRFNGRNGTLQLFVDQTDQVPLVANPDSLKLFDFLSAQTDRIETNHLTFQGRAIAIDNEGSFMRKKDYGRKSLEFDDYVDEVLKSIQNSNDPATARLIAANQIAPTLINKNVVDRLKKLTDQEWKDGLPGLSAQDLKDFLKRKEKAVAAIDKAEKALGNSIYPSERFSALSRDDASKQKEQLAQLEKTTRLPQDRKLISEAQQIINNAALNKRHLTNEEMNRVEFLINQVESYK